ncbi:YheC/YheD family protein [Paenibacillus kobensis]|uniref:YheC/YheD family protein n=1 Tax=Paenibacillus kobensis TaxID=59841 RepID=UPI000FDB7CF7|nr:YheC/YheD family protein [Paenibacillus kobensis]
MVESHGRRVPNKWVKTEALLGHSLLASHIPPTRSYTADNLRSMLNEHGMVVIKPVLGSGGNGVIKVQQEGSGYSYSYYARKRQYATFEALFASIGSVKKKRAYLIQKGIRLATIGGRPIDYRVKYEKTATGWIYRSMVGRLAKPGLFVTNLCRGGTMVTAAHGIRRSLSASQVASKKREMRELTVAATQVLESKFPGVNLLGYDYGIDRNGKIWIFEVNTKPQ